MYLRLLGDIEPDDLQVIVDQAVATCKFLPTVAELRDMRHAMTQMGELSWGEAWENVQSEIRRIGNWGTPQFRTELTAAVVRSMGWMERFTPTPVGNATIASRLTTRSAVHPHARGECRPGGDAEHVDHGSPPRPWGMRRGC